MIGQGDPRIEARWPGRSASDRRDVARGVDAIPDVGPELIEGSRAPGTGPPMPTIAIASSGCMVQLIDKGKLVPKRLLSNTTKIRSGAGSGSEAGHGRRPPRRRFVARAGIDQGGRADGG